MKSHKIFLGSYLLCLALLVINIARGQEMLGISQSNYAGIYGIPENPASMTASKLYKDINILGIQGSVYNNYIYVGAKDAMPLLFKRILPVYYTSEGEERNFKINTSDNNKFGYVNTRLEGPGIMQTYQKHAFGITTAFRTSTWFQDIPTDIAIYLYEAIDYDSLHNINFHHTETMKIGSMTWSELRLSYAYNFHRNRWNYWSAGINIKPLFGHAAMYTNINELNYEVYTDDSASVYNTSFEYGLSLPIDYNDNSFSPSPIIRGFGMATDIGVLFQSTIKGHQTYTYLHPCEAPFEEYNFRVGLSIKDLGFIKYSKKAISKEYVNSSAEWVKGEGLDKLPNGSVNEIVSKADAFFKNNAEEYIDNESFTIYLAPSLNLNIDVPLNRRVFINTVVNYVINFKGVNVYKPSILAIIPRYETSSFEVALPISVERWEILKPKVGLSVRYGSIFAGTNNLIPFSGISDVSGIEFYAGIRLNLSRTFRMNFTKGNCNRANLRNIETFDFRNF
jgi:hypothetical protein